MTLKPLGDSAWLVEFPGRSGGTALARVIGLVDALESNRPPGVLDVVPSFDSVAVHFENADGLEVLDWIRSVTVVDRLPVGEELRIPVCYGGEHGPDLEEVAEQTGMSAEEVVALHSSAGYTVAAVGFSPGFPYLLGLPERSICPAARRRGSRCPQDQWPWRADRRGSIHFRRPAGGMFWDGRDCVCSILCQPGRPCCVPATGCGSCPWKSSNRQLKFRLRRNPRDTVGSR